MEPAGHLAGAGGARRLRQPRIGDVTDQHVLEAEGLLAADRRTRLPDEEVAVDELLQLQLGRIGVLADRLDRSRPERAPATPHGAAPCAPRRAAGRCGRRSSPARSARSPSARLGLDEHPHRLLDEERVPVRRVEDGLALIGRELERARRRRARRRAVALVARKRLDSIEVARTLPPPQPGRSSSRSGRARQTIRSGTSRTPLARCSTRSSIGSSAQWMSENTSTSGCRSASSFAHDLSRPRDLRAESLAADRIEHTRREREQVGDRLVTAALPNFSAAASTSRRP